MFELEAPGSGPRNLQAEHARLLVASLADAGVRDVVASPGSRSTPFLLAVLAEERLRLHVRIDERTAAFFALGQSRTADRPSLLLCTSGTAGAHYLPAVLEAELAEVPLLVLTADRPPELVGCGANQTLDQTGLFGRHVRAAIEVPVADASPSALRGVRRAALRAVQAAVGGGRPGPVHLDARARKPLEPPGEAEVGAPERALRSEVDALLARPAPRPTRPTLAPDPAAFDALVADLRAAERPLLVAGPAPMTRAADAERWLRWAGARRIPVFAEATSQLRSGPAGDPGDPDPRIGLFDVLLRAGLFEREAPDLVLQLGAAPSGSAWERAPVADRHWLITRGAWTEPRGATTGLLVADDRALLAALEAAFPEPAAPGGARARWMEGLRRAARKAASAALVDDGGALHEGSAVRRAVEALPDGGVLAIGNSLPVRVLEHWAPEPLPRGVAVWSQRGLSGIDGLVSGFAGAAAASGRPVLGVLGDVSFLHDQTGLESALAVPGPLTYLVVDNAGGRIFEQLPIARRGGVDLTPWITPPPVDLGKLVRAWGIELHEVEDGEALSRTLRVQVGRPGVRVVRAKVPPSGAAAALAGLVARVRESLAEERA